MKQEKIQLPDYGAKDEKLALHRWLGANTVMSKYYGYDAQMEKTQAFLRNGVFNVDIFGIERNGGKLTAPLGSQPFEVTPGDTLTVSVVIQNKGIAHSFVPEQRDFYESWVEFEAKDAAGHTLTHSGGLRQDGSLDPRAHSFTNRLVNKKGGLNDLHQVWDTRVVAYNNTIQSGRSQIVRYEFKAPPDVTGSITVTAKINYRRFNQHFIDFGISKHYEMPVVEMASRARVLTIGTNSVSASDPQENKEWMRWNNYGIGLLDAQQYADSARAFQRVTEIRPDYADGFTNVAIADFQWERYDEARGSLENALQLAPHNARALYYLALVERTQGHLDAAINDLREVTAQFPRSRDAHRELGFSLYQQHKYDEARTEYETLQSIDPDDLAAFRTSIQELANSLDDDLPAAGLLVHANSALQTLEDYNRRTARYLKRPAGGQAVAVVGIVGAGLGIVIEHAVGLELGGDEELALGFGVGGDDEIVGFSNIVTFFNLRMGPICILTISANSDI